MNILIFTGNSIRHKYVANTLGSKASKSLTVVECGASDALSTSPVYAERHASEKHFFPGHDAFLFPSLPIMRGEVHGQFVLDAIRSFIPDIAFVFGSSILREPLLSSIPPGRFVNLHLGLSPYYRGSGTNFWPFINEELEYVGATLLHIDPGVDTGDIIAHVRPNIEHGDTVHSIGNKTIEAAADKLLACIDKVEGGEELQRIPQWEVDAPRYYKKSDITDEVQKQYDEKIADGLIDRHLQKQPAHIRLVDL